MWRPCSTLWPDSRSHIRRNISLEGTHGCPEWIYQSPSRRTDSGDIDSGWLVLFSPRRKGLVARMGSTVGVGAWTVGEVVLGSVGAGRFARSRHDWQSLAILAWTFVSTSCSYGWHNLFHRFSTCSYRDRDFRQRFQLDSNSLGEVLFDSECSTDYRCRALEEILHVCCDLWQYDGSVDKELLLSAAVYYTKQDEHVCSKLLQTVYEGKHVSNRATKDNFCKGGVAAWVQRVAQLHHCSQEAIIIQSAQQVGIWLQKTFCGFDSNFCLTIGLLVVCRRQPVTHPPFGSTQKGDAEREMGGVTPCVGIAEHSL